MNEKERAYDIWVNGRAISWLMENCGPCEDPECEECKQATDKQKVEE